MAASELDRFRSTWDMEAQLTTAGDLRTESRGHGGDAGENGDGEGLTIT